MLLMEPIWLLAGLAFAVAFLLATVMLLHKGNKDYSLDRNEGESAGFDLGAQQRELYEERARIEVEHKRAQSDAREMAQQASDALTLATREEGQALKELAQNSAMPMFDSKLPTAAQDAEIARIKAQQQHAIENARAEYERARDAHFSVLGRTEPKPAIVSYAMSSPLQALADSMQASYAQVAWAFAALVRKLE
jgi:hypothetical protein